MTVNFTRYEYTIAAAGTLALYSVPDALVAYLAGTKEISPVIAICTIGLFNLLSTAALLFDHSINILKQRGSMTVNFTRYEYAIATAGTLALYSIPAALLACLAGIGAISPIVAICSIVLFNLLSTAALLFYFR